MGNENREARLACLEANTGLIIRDINLGVVSNLLFLVCNCKTFGLSLYPLFLSRNKSSLDN